MILLFSPDILELLVQVSEFRGKFGDVRAVLIPVGLGATNDDVEIEPNVGLGGCCALRGGKTNGVVACLLGCECKLALSRSPRPYYVVSGVDIL